jgi:hypothetical protein
MEVDELPGDGFFPKSSFVYMRGLGQNMGMISIMKQKSSPYILN